jgi:hypothetical protein
MWGLIGRKGGWTFEYVEGLKYGAGILNFPDGLLCKTCY